MLHTLGAIDMDGDEALVAMIEGQLHRHRVGVTVEILLMGVEGGVGMAPLVEATTPVVEAVHLRG